jgi:hypothetical protein
MLQKQAATKQLLVVQYQNDDEKKQGTDGRRWPMGSTAFGISSQL